MEGGLTEAKRRERLKSNILIPRQGGKSGEKNGRKGGFMIHVSPN